MITIHLSADGAATDYAEEGPVLLSELFRRRQIPCAFPCGGAGSCGKCSVRVRGAQNPLAEKELASLSAEEINSGIRLACYCEILGEAEVTLLPASEDSILDWAKAAPAASGKRGLGVACDIGTTTLAMRLYDLSTGAVLARAAEANCQKVFGADVITRITACDEYGADHLSTLIRGQISRMAAYCMKTAGVDADRLDSAVVTGNTTMLHIFEGLNPRSLAVSPFALQSAFGLTSRHALLDAPIYLPGCIGAYIGADVVCALLAAGVFADSTSGAGTCSLLADIGTNGEMALILPDGRISCCSAPAGPAFEGAGIFMGSGARAGAVKAAQVLSDGRVLTETVGGGPASTICGSGLIDCVAAMLRLDAMDETGFLESDFVLPDTPIRITQADIRQVQLAKAAIAGGIRTLLAKSGVQPAEIGAFFIAGGFGNYLNLSSASQIGLLPAELIAAAEFIGNASLAGASMLLLDDSVREQERSILERSEELHLATDPGFTANYIDAMSF